MAKKQSPSPLAEDAAPLDIPEAVGIVEGDEASFADIIPVGHSHGGAAVMPRHPHPAVSTRTGPGMFEDEGQFPPLKPREAKEVVAAAVVIPPSGIVAVHALDTAPVGSKIVVVRHEGATYAQLARPDAGIKTLPKDDPAAKLPEGAVIRKVADGFESVQLSPAIEYPPMKTATVADAITGFVPYFHRAD